MSSFKLNGLIKVVNPTIKVSDKFSKREFVVTDSSDTYPQDISLQLTQDKCSMLDGVNPGANVEVEFNLRGREWTSPQGEVKYFNTLEAWKVNVLSKGSTPTNSSPSQSNEEDALPF
jgi:hypothetical protein